MISHKPFENTKVIELASVLAGPAVGMFFAELEADVIKIENKLNNGDVTRTWKNKNEDPKSAISAYYASVNWGKKSLMLDFNSSTDMQQVYHLIQEADIVISNFKKGDDVKFKLDDNTIQKINPSIIIGKINGYGAESDKVAYDLILQAESGFMSINGTKESGPIKMPVALIDVLAAHQLKEGLLIAFINKLKTGKGAVVEVSLYDAAIASLMNQASNYLFTNHVPGLSGSLHPNIAPYGEIFITKDNKQMVLAIGSDKQFNALCDILSIENNPLFATNSDRIKNRSQLQQVLGKEIIKHSSEFLDTVFQKKHVPAGIIKNIGEVLNDAPKNLLLSFDKTGKNIVKSSIFKITSF